MHYMQCGERINLNLDIYYHLGNLIMLEETILHLEKVLQGHRH